MEILLIEIENINYMLDKISKELLKDLTPEERNLKLAQYDYLETRYKHLEKIIKEANYENINIDNRDNDRNRTR